MSSSRPHAVVSNTVTNPILTKALDALMERESAFTADQFFHHVLHFPGNNLSPEQISEALQTALLASRLIVPCGLSPSGQPVYSTPDMVSLESDMLRTATLLAQANSPWLSADIDRTLVWKAIEQKVARKKHSIEDKRDALEKIFDAGQFVVVSGPPGSGKLNIAASAAIIWRHKTEYKNHRVTVVALAEDVARQTAERMEADHFVDLATLLSEDHDLLDSMGPQDLLTIEEAGLLDSRQFHQLLTRSRLQGFTLLAIGDHWQLPPQGPGVPLRVFARHIPVVEVKGFFRQKNPVYREASEALWENQNGRKALDVFHKHQGLLFLDEIPSILDAVDDTYYELTRGQKIPEKDVGILVQNDTMRKAVAGKIAQWETRVCTTRDAQGLNFERTIAVVTQDTCLEEALAFIGRHKTGATIIVHKDAYADLESLTKAWSTPSGKLTTLDNSPTASGVNQSAATPVTAPTH